MSNSTVSGLHAIVFSLFQFSEENGTIGVLYSMQHGFSFSFRLFPVCLCVFLCRSPYGIVPGGAHDQMGGGMNAFGENHILLFTIFNPLYPITVVGQD